MWNEVNAQFHSPALEWRAKFRGASDRVGALDRGHARRDEAGSALAVEALLDLLLIAGAYFAASRAGGRWPFLALSALTLLGRWAALISGDGRFELGSSAITVTWIGAAITIVGTELFRQRSVTTNMILGAIVAYLLAAVGFAYLFEVLERLRPGAFSGIPEGADAEAVGDVLLCFSLVTLTTLGYGGTSCPRPASHVRSRYSKGSSERSMLRS
ncbi:MAG: hypothetical protein WBN70_05265 [Polyangiales bacterium]